MRHQEERFRGTENWFGSSIILPTQLTYLDNIFCHSKFKFKNLNGKNMVDSDVEWNITMGPLP